MHPATNASNDGTNNEEGSNCVREINSNTSIRKGPKGDYLFYKTPRMKKPKFYDIKSFVTELNPSIHSFPPKNEHKINANNKIIKSINNSPFIV